MNHFAIPSLLYSRDLQKKKKNTNKTILQHEARLQDHDTFFFFFFLACIFQKVYPSYSVTLPVLSSLLPVRVSKAPQELQGILFHKPGISSSLLIPFKLK